MKIFRDDIWGRLRPTFQSDHRRYKKHGVYDFPQNDYKMRIIGGIFVLLTRISAFRKEYARRTKSEMGKSLQRIVEKS